MGEHIHAPSTGRARRDQRQAVLADRLVGRDILIADRQRLGIGRRRTRIVAKRLNTASIRASAQRRLIAVGRVAPSTATACARLASELSARIASARP
jgi:hypothetical protein